MTREDIDRLAQEAGFKVGPSRDGPDDVWGVSANLERFAALVAAAEREACAKVCEEPGWNAANWCAKAIRARGQQ
jgi:hypothetical protein